MADTSTYSSSDLFDQPWMRLTPPPAEGSTYADWKSHIQERMDANKRRLQVLRPEQAGIPSALELDQGQAAIEGEYAQKLLEQLQGIHAPERPTLTAPNVTPLTLPNAPGRTPPHGEPVSSLAAGILGLVAPNYAGDFGAAALHGAIQENERQNQARQEQFVQDVQKRIALHNDELRRANAQAEIENENKMIGYDNALDKTKTEKEMAVAANKASKFQGVSEYLKTMVPRVKKGEEAALEAGDIRAEQTLLEKQHDVLARTEELKQAKEADLAQKREHDRIVSEDKAKALALRERISNATNRIRQFSAESQRIRAKAFVVAAEASMIRASRPTGGAGGDPAARAYLGSLKAEMQQASLNRRSAERALDAFDKNTGYVSGRSGDTALQSLWTQHHEAVNEAKKAEQEILQRFGEAAAILKDQIGKTKVTPFVPTKIMNPKTGVITEPPPLSGKGWSLTPAK